MKFLFMQIETNKNTKQQNTKNSGESWMEWLIFNHRIPILFILILVTVLLGYQASRLRPESSFLKMIPTEHPYIANFMKHETDLAQLGNSVRITVENTQGNIFNAEYLETLRQINDDVFFIKGVNRGAMESLWTPMTRWLEVNADGFDGGPVIPDSYSGTPAGLAQIKLNVMRSGQIGKMIANNFKSTIVFAPLMETDIDTGQPLDYWALSKDLEKIREKYQNGATKIHITGFAKIVGDMIDGLTQVVVFFIIAVAITLIILFSYFRALRSAVLPVLVAIVAVIWQLGLLKTFGFGLDPYSMLVPFLIFAIAVSHGVQMVNVMQTECLAGAEGKVMAARMTFRRLCVPSLSALVTDGIGFLTLLVIKIQVIQDLAIGASLGVLVLIVLVLFLLPILMSFAGISPRVLNRIQNFRADKHHPIFSFLARLTTPRWAGIAIAIAMLAYGFGIYHSRDLPIGDIDPGAPELRADSRYNKDNAFLRENYATSSDLFIVMVEKKGDPCGEYSNLVAMDILKWELTHLEGVQTVQTMADDVRKVLIGFNEADLRFGALNRRTEVVNNAMQYVGYDKANRTCTLAMIRINLKDHKASTLQRVVDLVEKFSAEYDTDDAKFVMAAGSAGIEAATNIEINKAQYTMLFWVYGVVILVVLLAFRSPKAVLCIVLPLGLTSVLCRVVMLHLDIGVKVATLPVIALGVGVGVDYGIYIYDRIQQYMKEGMPLFHAYFNTLKTTCRAVVITSITLAIGVCTWVFSPIKFQADMGLLLTFMFLVNMVGAVVLIPAIAGLLWKDRNKNANLEDPSAYDVTSKGGTDNCNCTLFEDES